jgi:DNA-directed RNA polymerase specialized sigma24 family protein
LPGVVRVDSTATDRFDTSRFEASRIRLAYRLLGSVADAQDAVQEAFLRWQSADRRRIKVPEAWLTKVVTNLCLDRLRSAQARRERTVGAWLPEPLLEGDPMRGPADTFEQRESVSLAVLTLMARLEPLERAVYRTQDRRGILAAAFSGGTERLVALLTDDATAISEAPAWPRRCCSTTLRSTVPPSSSCTATRTSAP